MAYDVLKATVNEMSLDEIQNKYSGDYNKLLPFLSNEMVEKYFEVLLTLVIKNEQN